jgi:hypothetical protein
MWISGSIGHEVRTLGDVGACSLYLEPAAGGMPDRQ